MRSRSNLTLPPTDTRGNPLRCTITKRHQHISFVFTDPTNASETTVFTIHQVDAKRIKEALAEAVESPATENFELCEYGRTGEGICRGGPPGRDQLTEFDGRRGPA